MVSHDLPPSVRTLLSTHHPAQPWSSRCTAIIPTAVRPHAAIRLPEEAFDDDDYYIAAALLTDIEHKKTKRKRRGSVMGREIIYRDRFAGNLRTVVDYFANPPIYNAKLFRRRFRMSRELFLRIVASVEAHDDYFRQRPNTVGLLGATALQKVYSAVRMLAYDILADSLDEVVRISESTMIEAFKHFVKAVVDVFADQYLRAPTADDTARLMAMNTPRGFPGMLGYIDCMHWRWKNCPAGWKGQYSGHVDRPTMILEAVASKDLWIWHSFFGLPGSLNDINVLQRSPLFQRLTSRTAPELEFMVNGKKYIMGYYLADGIYPSWATFVKTISNPQDNKRIHYTKVQDGVRKDVERAFGVLQARFAMVRGPARFWDTETLWYIMTACVIMHNMIIDSERDEDVDFNYDQGDSEVLRKEEYQRRNKHVLEKFLQIHKEIEDRQAHEQLRDDLVEHLWALHGAR
uniref:Harbinger transposon protein n=1 Tax=Oryza rufipogon TaxID=4529 RepID=A0A2I4S5Z0_ORYRU|nr:Harbinger transposon protein [Oryza rufipogon]